LKGFRITKYDPSFRDSEGRYLKDTWTSVSDIGRIFDGNVLTEEDYHRIEQLYIDAVVKIANILKVTTLQIRSLEKTKEYIDQGSWIDIHSNDYRKLFYGLTEGLCISITEIEYICKLILREQLWCKLESDKMLVHFGYDFYMYIVISQGDHEFVRTVIPAELFIEEMISPYMVN